MEQAMEFDFEQARFNMVEQQIRPWDVLDPEVLSLLQTLKREDFVPAAHRAIALADLEIPLGNGDVMLAPRVEARALQALAVQKNERALEIGTGSGFMAALLGSQAAQVVSVELRADLVATARANLERAGIANVTVTQGDGAKGWDKDGSFDVILLSGGVPVLPEAFLKQLKVGGRLLAFVGEDPLMVAQLVTRTGEETYATINLFETVVPQLKNAQPRAKFTF